MSDPSIDVTQAVVVTGTTPDASQAFARFALFNEDGTELSLSGGSSGPLEVQTGLYFGSIVVPTGSSYTPWDWPAVLEGTDLFDLTDPANPVALADGIYTLNALVYHGGAVAGKTFTVAVDIDPNDYDANQVITQTLDVDGLNRVYVTLSFFVAAGQPIATLVVKHDHSADLTFSVSVPVLFQPAARAAV